MDMTNTTPAVMQQPETAPGTSAAPESINPSTLAEYLGTEQEQQPTNQPVQEAPQQPVKEPGYLAGKRAEWEAARAAETQQLMDEMSVLREYVYNAEADKLIASGKVSDRDIALAYVRGQGIKPSAPAEQPVAVPQPRDAQGRFVSANTQPDASTQQRAANLFNQAQTIKRTTGVDVLGLYNQNTEVRQKILSGEWDFADVYENSKAPTAAHVNAPTPVRGSNGIELGDVDISKMSDAQFDKMNDLLKKGGKINMNK